MDGDLSALNFTPNAVSQHRTITFQPDVLPRCYLLLQVSDVEDAVIWCYIIFSGLSNLLVASALAILQQRVLKRSTADDGLVPVNSSTLWTNLRLLIKMMRHVTVLCTGLSHRILFCSY